jgi:hypothetical protein
MSPMFDLPVPPPPVAEVVEVRPAWDLTLGLISATVQIDQPLADGANRRVGAAFLVEAPGPDGLPRTVMVTAAHVLDGMSAGEARIGWRTQAADGGWRFAPEPLRIRDEDGAPRWTRHPERDVAVMAVSAPPEFARAAIPLGWLAGAETLDAWQVGPGDELMTLGYPHGYAANKVGFPILRTAASLHGRSPRSESSRPSCSTSPSSPATRAARCSGLRRRASCRAQCSRSIPSWPASSSSRCRSAAATWASASSPTRTTSARPSP